MVHEREDKYEVQEDGEYHFSDDQANYEVEPETAKTAAPSTDLKKTAQDLFLKFKKPLLGLGGFLILIFVVYKILAPASTAPSTEFGQSAPVTQVTARKQPVTAPAPVAQPAAPNITPQVQQAAAPEVAVPESPPVAPPSVIGSAPSPGVIAEAPLAPVTTAPVSPAVTIVPAGAEVVQAEAIPPPPISGAVPGQQQPVNKITEYEAQTNAMQGRIQDMTMRLASMESAIARLGQVIQELKNSKSGVVEASPRPVAKSFIPKITYTVQAIIPGRAWLKSENGETVTVTEGDTLQGYGRIMKIDPYDGVVQIAVGGRIISLSYGAGNE